MIAVTETFFPASVERVVVIVELPIDEEEQQVEEDVGETDEADPVVGAVAAAVAQEAETEVEPPLVPEVEDDDEFDPTEPDDFQDCVDGHQPGPGPGPSPGPFCSDILS